MLLDTHKQVEKLIATGALKKTAEAFVEIVSERNDNLATKADLLELKLELKGDIAELRTELKCDIKDLKIDLLKWIIPLFLSVTLSVIGLIITVLFLK